MATKTEPTTTKVVAPKKKSALQTVIDEKMLPTLVNGSVWKQIDGESDEEYLARLIRTRETIGRFLKVVKAALKMFDDELKNQRNIHGEDHLTGVNWFRKPRTAKEKSGNSLLDELSFDDDDEEVETD